MKRGRISSLNLDRASLSSAKGGFLLTDALIALVLVSVLAVSVSMLMRSHENSLDLCSHAMKEIEQEAVWHLSECRECIIEPETEDSFSAAP